MGTIALEGLEFFAYHGVMDEEQKIGNKYSIDVIIDANVDEAAQHDRLRDTINYQKIYKITADVMKQRARLLEHIAFKIIRGIKTEYPNINTVEVSVSKYNPPVGGVCLRSKITLKE